MRILSFRKLAAASAAVGVGVLALLSVARPATAQILPDTPKPPVLTVRGGVYFPFNARAKNSIGKTWYGGGLDYAFQQTAGVSRTCVGLDYIERSSGSNTVRIIPLTVSQFSEQGSANGIRPYFGVGAGAYFVHQDIPNDIGVRENTNATALGGFVAAGLDLPGNFLVEARYHYITKVGSSNNSGLQVMAGVRL